MLCSSQVVMGVCALALGRVKQSWASAPLAWALSPKATAGPLQGETLVLCSPYVLNMVIQVLVQVLWFKKNRKVKRKALVVEIS